MGWSIKDIPSQAGKLALVTGATGGLGYETALELARAGADVVLTGRNPAKGASALQRIKAEVPGA
ncbi:MAG: SDR family NAD(P)-dependent oxidoreductase, partial [Devosia sp.]|nr:SDR family NAD(P)-dependent oxidoreductase [Devosia sp.]